MDHPLKISGFLIDMDGLLLDTERVSQRCWEEAERETGYRLPDGFYFSLVGQSMRRIEQRLREVMDPGCDVGEFLRTASRIYTDAIVAGAVPVKPGAGEFLVYLHDHAIPGCLATSTGRELCQRKLGGCGLDRYLPMRVCGNDVENSKPAPDIYLAAAARLGRKPSSLLALEDSENGLRAAIGAGCRTAHIPDIAPVSTDVQVLADRVYRDLFQVLAALERAEIVVTR